MTCPLLILFEWRGNCSRFCKTKPSTSISLDYHVDFGVLVKLQKVDKTCIVAQIWTILSRMTGKVLTGCTMTEETKRAFSTFWTRGREGWISVVKVSFTAVWSQFQHQWPNRPNTLESTRLILGMHELRSHAVYDAQRERERILSRT